MECAGNGRARLEPHAGEPAVAARSGRHGALERDAAARRCSRRPAWPRARVEVLFTGLDRGVEGGEEQRFQRSLPLDEALGDDVLLAYDMNGAPLPPQHGFPLRLLVPGWYGMTNVKWLDADRACSTGRSAATSRRRATAYGRTRTRTGEPLAADAAAVADRPAGDPRVPDPRADGRGRASACSRAAPGRAWRRSARRGRAPTAARRGPSRARPGRRPLGVARLALRAGTPQPGEHVLCSARATRPATSSRSSRRGTSAATRTTRCRRVRVTVT